jgi:hypothetical protein
MNKNQRLIIITAVAIFVGLIVFSLGTTYLQSQKSKLVIKSVPDDSKVTLDGKSINNNGTVYVPPGKHTIKATRNAFKDQSQDFTIKSGESKDINFYMLSDGDAGRKWLADHPDKASEIEGYYGELITNKANNIYQNNPILQQLPVIDRTYRIDFGVSKKTPPGDYALYIQAADQDGRADALDWMKVSGYKPSNYEIVWVDPLTQAETSATPAELSQ